MEATHDTPLSASKIKRSGSHNLSSSSAIPSSNPTTFFLKSEKELERPLQRGRKKSRAASATLEDRQTVTSPSLRASRSFGVESLEETIGSAISSTESSLSRTNSNTAEAATMDLPVPSRSDSLSKRRTGNPVHPKILATGQRIISSEWTPTQSTHLDSPTSIRSSESPYRVRTLRRGSTTSSIILSQPGTPIKSPDPPSAMPSTPRSASPKSFRLSDEEGSNGEAAPLPLAKATTDSLPQLVMPSLSMPRRRSFTELGRRMGRLKVMVIGPKSVGKTSFINSIFRVCQHVVDVHEVDDLHTSQISCDPDIPLSREHTGFRRSLASTRPQKPWWTASDSDHSAASRRSSNSTNTPEYNLTFIDTPGLTSDEAIQEVSDYLDSEVSHSLDPDSLQDEDWLDMLNGNGGSQLDAVIYIFEPTSPTHEDGSTSDLTPSLTALLQRCTKFSNFIPVVGKSDTLTALGLLSRKRQILKLLQDLDADRFLLIRDPQESGSTGTDFIRAASTDSVPTISSTPREPFAISSILGDDQDVIDASILMSSQYLQPLVPSDFNALLDRLFDSENLARLKHLSANKVMQSRNDNPQRRSTGVQRYLCLPRSALASPGDATLDSMVDGESKVMVPHGSSSYFRSVSPSASEVSMVTGSNPGHQDATVARYGDQTQTAEPFRQVRLAKWAQDLQRSLHNERERFKQMYQTRPASWAADTDSEGDSNKALVPTRTGSRPARGKLGGELAIIDPSDPLGLLAFGHAVGSRGMLALQVAGSFGLIGAVAYWMVKNWVDIQTVFGWDSTPTVMVNAAAVPPSGKNWLDEASIRSWLGKSR